MKTKTLLKVNEALKEKHKFLLDQLKYRDDRESEEEKKETEMLMELCDEVRRFRTNLIDEIYNRIKIELNGKINRTNDAG